MHHLFSIVIAFALSSITTAASSSSSSSAAAASSTAIGYDGPSSSSSISSTSTNSSLSFGRHYAILNLDLINGLVSSVASTSSGRDWINNTAHWINTVHSQNPPPLSLFTRIYFANARKPEIRPGSGFSMTSMGLTTKDTNATKIYPAFVVDEKAGDVVLQKTGFSATTGNEMTNILRNQGIDTVVLSGIRTSGVILSTAYDLFDLGYTVYVVPVFHLWLRLIGSVVLC